MVKNSHRIYCVLAAMLAAGAPAAAITSHGLRAFSASVTPSGIALTIHVEPLPAEAFFGKNVIIPVTVESTTGELSTTNLLVTMMYQLMDASGKALGPPVTVLITFPPVAHADSPTSAKLTGYAMIPTTDLEPIRHGGALHYIFQAQQGGAHTLFTAAGTQQVIGAIGELPTPFATTIINKICKDVDAAGAVVVVPDLFEHDGHTTVALPPNAISGAGKLCIAQEPDDGWPLGPGSGKPVQIYTVTLEGAALTQTATLTISYPSDANGQLLNLKIDPRDLAIFWLGPETVPRSAQTWHILSHPTLDLTLHTIAGTTSHFSTFGLFVPGATAAAAASRPSSKIITPNGDGQNDSLIFAADVETVSIFNVRGQQVKSLRGPSPAWDGTDDSGKIVESGVYIYQYTSQGERVSGVVAVAK